MEKKRNIGKFILMGHSFGGYLSCAYALKYNKKIIERGISLNLIEKLILISPVGVERSQYSLLKRKQISLHRCLPNRNYWLIKKI